MAQRPGLSFYTWSPDSPYYRTLPADRAASEAVTTRWAVRVVLDQPGVVERLVEHHLPLLLQAAGEISADFARLAEVPHVTVDASAAP